MSGAGLKRPRVCVQGLGFVGSAMAIAVASARDEDGRPRYDVVGVELDTPDGRAKVEAINAGRLAIEAVDPALRAALGEARIAGNLSATTDPSAYATASIVVMDVPLDVDFGTTPPRLRLEAFRPAIRVLGQHLPAGALVIVETTVPPGTCAKIVAPELATALAARGLPGDAILVAHAYERVMPGDRYLESIVSYWRVYAGLTPEAADACERFLSSVVNVRDFPLTRLHSTTASELGKVLENSFRAMNIAFVDEWGRFAEAVGVDLFQVIRAIRRRPTHANLMQPGFGVGGYCLTKDPLMGKLAARELWSLDLEFPFSERAVEVNRRMPHVTVDRVSNALGGDLRGKSLLLLGVSYRQDVGDTRYSPSETFVREAELRGARVACHDPLVPRWGELGRDVATTLPAPNGVDAVVFAVPHREYRDVAPAWLAGRTPLIFDANDVLTTDQRRAFAQAGCRVECIGRGSQG